MITFYDMDWNVLDVDYGDYKFIITTSEKTLKLNTDYTFENNELFLQVINEIRYTFEFMFYIIKHKYRIFIGIRD